VQKLGPMGPQRLTNLEVFKLLWEVTKGRWFHELSGYGYRLRPVWYFVFTVATTRHVMVFQQLE